MKSPGGIEGKLFVVYFLEGYIGVAPTVVGLIRELTAVGHQVHVRALPSDYASAVDLPASCRVEIISRLKEHRRGARIYSCLRSVKLVTLVPFVELAWFSIQCWLADLRMARELRRLRRVDIGIDPRGSILAWGRALLGRSKYICLSLELTSPALYRRFERLVFWLEGKALKHAAAIVIQDEDRLRSLARYHSPLASRVYFLPNSTGSGGGGAGIPSRENYLRSRLNIDPAEFPFIALHAGMIQDEVYAQELAKAFGQLNTGFALVFHDRIKRSVEEPYIRLLQDHNSTNLFLSLDPVPFDQVDAIFASATVGLVFYRPVNDNFAEMSLASGKLSFYLKHGVPVVMNSLPALAALNQRYQFGALVKDPGSPAELREALGAIMARYEFHSSNARRCFREEFNFDEKFAPIRAFLESL